MDKKKLKQLADYAVTEGLEHSENGLYRNDLSSGILRELSG